MLILRIHVAPGRETDFETAVAERAERHRTLPGFERMYLLRGAAAGEYRLVSWWAGLDDPEAWVRKEQYALAEDRRRPGMIVGTVDYEALQVAQRF